MKIRRWEFRDNLPISRLEEKYFPDPWSVEMLSETFLSGRFLGLICEEKGEIAGYIGTTYCLDEAEITMIAVSESFRRKGVASVLLSSAEKVLSDLGVNRMLLEVRKSNEGAQACYRKNGYTFLAVRERYYRNTEDALIMEKKF